MGEKFRDILEEAAKEAAKKETKSEPKKGKMLKQLHALDDTIEDFIDKVEDEIMSVEDNPVFVKKAHQLLADMSKEYSEFILALRSIVNAVDRKEKILPAFEKQESKVRDVLDGAGGPQGPEEPEGEEPPPEAGGEEPPPEDDKDDEDEYELKVSKKKLKEALMGEGKFAGFPKNMLMQKFYDFDDIFVGIEWNTLGYGTQYSIIKKAMSQIDKALRSIK